MTYFLHLFTMVKIYFNILYSGVCTLLDKNNNQKMKKQVMA